ncbi:putative beta-lysine N-acetyltransferase [Desertibacillus haloalkaliphilus]|uniref:putative beta-lysine N-acetyltransferase n=1 Tax=Desertibacillus haloalkaliphilus TaxID=1328930 RepID=UPI001C264BBA|nr:putative beta-lysine N-acetyltransferase [Desertibacillus haloalkaliphilus]MBU8908027.1 putative beta-lysine N-acetyltransferase [Desertibacillus haloalkaliphilus]
MNTSYAEVDVYNDRIVAYVTDSPQRILCQIDSLQQEHQTGKTIIYSIKVNEPTLRRNGYQLEGKIDGLFNGQQGYVFSKFYNKERKTSNHANDQEKIREIAARDKKKILEPLEQGISIEVFRGDDHELASLASLYQKVFDKYPTNIFDIEYIKKSMNDNYFFVVAKHDEKIVCVASAAINQFHSAEITDCAADPDYRGKNLLIHVIRELETQLKRRNIYHFYSLTRAISPGMNLTIKRLGYTYQGTLVKNCVIGTGFEDMNIWTKQV